MKGTKTQIKKTQKALTRGKTKQGKSWENYRKRKEQIQKSRRIGSMRKQAMIQKELEKARGKVSYNWGKYRESKFSYYNISRFKGLKYIGKKKTKPTLQEYYKVRNVDNLDSIVKNIFDNYKVRYILVIFVMRAPAGNILHASDVYTKPAFDALQERGVTLFESATEKLSFLKTGEGAELLETHIRVIYAGSKAN